MSPQVFHDTLKLFGTLISVMVGAVALVVCGSLLFSESNSGARPEGCGRQAKSLRPSQR